MRFPYTWTGHHLSRILGDNVATLFEAMGTTRTQKILLNRQHEPTPAQNCHNGDIFNILRLF